MSDNSPETPDGKVIVIPDRRANHYFTPPMVLVVIGIVLNAIGLVLIGMVALNTNDTVKSPTFKEQEQQVVQHRIRNEEAHACLDALIKNVAEGVNRMIRHEATQIDIHDTCPPPLTPQQIEDIKKGTGPHSN